MNRLIIIGASGHGKVVADIALRNGYEQVVFLDDNPDVQECAGFPVIGKTTEAPLMEGDKIVAIGNPKIREYIQKSIQTVTLIHPTATISRRVKIGQGTVVMAGAVINSDVEIGDGCIINTCASVDHDCCVKDFAHISVGAHIAGTCQIGVRTWIGAGAIVSNNVNITKDCMIGAGAVVVRDIEKTGTYIGVPAKEKNMYKHSIISGGGVTYCNVTLLPITEKVAA